MKRFPSVKKNREYQKIYDTGISRGNRLLVLYIMKNGRNGNRLGISVSKKTGNSVLRHRMARILREIFRLNGDYVQQGYDMVVVVRQPAGKASYAEIEKAYRNLIERLSLNCRTADERQGMH
jgi:ribonuclease P protein component